MERSVSKLIAVTIAVWIGLIMAALIAGAVFAALACAIAWGLAQFFWLAVQRLRRPAEQTDDDFVAPANENGFGLTAEQLHDHRVHAAFVANARRIH
jgi:hypothetical protein